MHFHHQNIVNTGLPWKQETASTFELEAVIGEQHAKFLARYADDGLLYNDPDRGWEVLRPGVLEEIRRFSNKNSDFKLDLALFAVLQGFEEGSGGAALEEPVLNWCCKANFLAPAMPAQTVKKDQYRSVDLSLCGKMLKVTNDHGADAFWFQSRNDVIYVSLVQIKLGKAGSKITYGGESGVFDTKDTLYCIFRRAIVALAQLRTIMFPQTNLVIKQLVLITSKKVDEKIVGKANTENLWGAVEELIVADNIERKKKEEGEKGKRKPKTGVQASITKASNDSPALVVHEKEEFFSEILAAEKRKFFS
jgi:hypothetical protein